MHMCKHTGVWLVYGKVHTLHRYDKFECSYYWQKNFHKHYVKLWQILI